MKLPRFHRRERKPEPDPYEDIIRMKKSVLVGIEVTIQRHTHPKIRVAEDYAIEA